MSKSSAVKADTATSNTVVIFDLKDLPPIPTSYRSRHAIPLILQLEGDDLCKVFEFETSLITYFETNKIDFLSLPYEDKSKEQTDMLTICSDNITSVIRILTLLKQNRKSIMKITGKSYQQVRNSQISVPKGH